MVIDLPEFFKFLKSKKWIAKSFIQRFLNHCLPKFIRFEFSPSKRMKKNDIRQKKKNEFLLFY